VSVDFREPLKTAEFQPSYELTGTEVSDLSRRLLQERPSYLDDQFVVYEMNGTDEFSNIGRYVEAQAFDETFNEKVDDMEKSYGEYEGASTFFVVMDQKSQQPAGVLRIIRNSERGLKTLNDIAGEPLNIAIEDFMKFHNVESLDNTWDVGTVAILPEYRASVRKSIMSKNTQPNILLYRSLYKKAENEGIEHFVSVIDRPAHNNLNALGVPFVPINGSKPFKYVNSQSSTALYGHVPEFYDRMEAKRLEGLEKSGVRNKAIALAMARPLGQLMLGENTDHALLLDYK
jgi:hypothetical protein